MTREPLASFWMRSFSPTGLPFFVHIIWGGGSPLTVQFKRTFSAMRTARSPGGTITLGGTGVEVGIRVSTTSIITCLGHISKLFTAPASVLKTYTVKIM